MNINIKLNTAYGVLSPDSVTLADNEGVVFTAPDDNGGLLINEKLYIPTDGKIAVSRSDLKDCNVCAWVKTENGSIVRKWRLNSFIVERYDGAMTYFDELQYYKNKMSVMQTEIDRLKEFRANATTDIKTLTAAFNKLSEEFKAVKEEMAL